jgi:hypothetical protein
MIAKKNLPMRAIFFRDHEISRLRLAAAPSPLGRPGGPGKDLKHFVRSKVTRAH